MVCETDVHGAVAGPSGHTQPFRAAFTAREANMKGNTAEKTYNGNDTVFKYQ